MNKTVACMLGIMLLAACEHYSDGTRFGTIQKFSKRGYAFKTWEGELNMNLPGMAVTSASIWKFSVKDPAVADSLNKHLGEHVKVTYNEVRFLNWGQNEGETNCFVTGVTRQPLSNNQYP